LSEKKYILRGARIIDPQVNLDQIADIVIEEGYIKEIGNVKDTKGEKLDLTGKIIVPGLFDMHTHLRDPGDEDTENIISGCAAAAAGGFTGIACMPDTDPKIDTSGIVEYIKKRAEQLPVYVYPVASATSGSRGEKLSEMYDLQKAGAVAFSDDESPIIDSDIIRRALEYASDLNGMIIQHAEDTHLSDGVMHEGVISTRLGLAPIPALCEEVIVFRDIRISEYINGTIHFAHVSTSESVEHIRKAKGRGLKVSAEVTPHNLFLTDEAVIGYDTNTKVYPPLRSDDHRQALLEGLLDGTIDCIASDHSPHAQEDKEQDYNTAPFGIIGLETSLGLVLTELLHTGKINWNDLVEKMSIAPRRILHLPKIKIAKGEIAELTIIDPELQWTVIPDQFKSQARNTPFAERELKGRAFGIFNKGSFTKSF